MRTFTKWPERKPGFLETNRFDTIWKTYLSFVHTLARRSIPSERRVGSCSTTALRHSRHLWWDCGSSWMRLRVIRQGKNSHLRVFLCAPGAAKPGRHRINKWPLNMLRRKCIIVQPICDKIWACCAFYNTSMTFGAHLEHIKNWWIFQPFHSGVCFFRNKWRALTTNMENRYNDGSSKIQIDATVINALLCTLMC